VKGSAPVSIQTVEVDVHMSKQVRDDIVMVLGAGHVKHGDVPWVNMIHVDIWEGGEFLHKLPIVGVDGPDQSEGGFSHFWEAETKEE
jgi:hypothetical protein